MKVIKNITNIRKNLDADKPVPLSITINITGRCNLKCEFCEKGHISSGNEIDIEHIKKLVDFSLEYNCPVYLGGGEPFLHRHIWEILQYCMDAGKKVSLVTNGTRFDKLTEKHFELLSNSIDILTVSLDSTDPLEHDRVRGKKGTYDKVLRFLNNPLRKNKVRINSILAPDLKGVQSMIDLAKNFKCSINFLPLIFESNFPGLDRLEWKKNIQETMTLPADMIEKLQYCHEYAKKLHVVTNLQLLLLFIEKYYQYASTDKYFFDYVINKFLCFIPFQQLFVNEEGRIMPCVFLPGEGSIYDGDIYENWLNSALKYRKILKDGKRFDVCRSCTCHFAENCRSSIIAFPFANRDQLLWMSTYYLKRLVHGEGRK